jgi:hypothetical protein
MAVGRKHRIEDSVHDPVSNDEGDAFQQHSRPNSKR